MNSEEKIEYMLNKIRERAIVSPPGYFFVNCFPFVDVENNGGFPDDAPVLFSSQDQADYLQKFKRDGLLFDVVLEKDGAMVALGTLDKDSKENPYKQKDKNILRLVVRGGKLFINKRTGLVRLNKVETTFNPICREFKALLAIVEAKDHLVTFKEFFNGYKLKTGARRLSFVLRDLKNALGILPEDNPKNKDIFENIPGYGYKLITPKNKRKKNHN